MAYFASGWLSTANRLAHPKQFSWPDTSNRGEINNDVEWIKDREERAGKKEKLTCEGVVTLISGTKLSSNRLMMFSCFISLDGVSFGGGGTGGPFLNCMQADTRRQHRQQHPKNQRQEPG